MLTQDAAGRVFYRTEDYEWLPAMGIHVDNVQALLIDEALQDHAYHDPSQREWHYVYTTWHERTEGRSSMFLHTIIRGREPPIFVEPGMIHRRTIRMIPLALREFHRHPGNEKMYERWGQLWEHVLTYLMTDTGEVFIDLVDGIDLTTDKSRDNFVKGAIYHEKHKTI